MAGKTNEKPKTKPEESSEEETSDEKPEEPAKDKPNKGGNSWEQKFAALEEKVNSLLMGSPKDEPQRVKVPKIPEPEAEPEQEEEPYEEPEVQSRKRNFWDWLL